MTKHQLAREFIKFLKHSTTPYHAVEAIAAKLMEHGFKEVKEKEAWKVNKNDSFFVIREDSSIVAVRTAGLDQAENGFRIIGAHTDSPSLKVKSVPEKRYRGYLSLGVEVYGSALLQTWFDRDLSIAGRVSFLDGKNRLCSTLIDFRKPVGVVPNLAIHLTSKSGENQTVNRQTELPPLIMLARKKKDAELHFHEILSSEIERDSANRKVKEILDFDLFFYDTQPASFIGLNKEFITGQRLDNLLSCFAGMQALLESEPSQPTVLVCNDHEEVGSNSATGAGGTLVKSVLERLCREREEFRRALSQSFLVSVDNAHGVHPNYPSKHDENHGPVLNGGPVIKLNANQRYATTSRSSAFFKYVCRKAEVPVQSFIMRSDMPCGSTIGPITSTNLGVSTLDIGAPTFAMHSIRETCGSSDIWYLYKALREMCVTRLE